MTKREKEMVQDLEARNHILAINIEQELKEVENDIQWFRRCLPTDGYRIPISPNCIATRGRNIDMLSLMIQMNEATIRKIKYGR